MPAHTIHPHSLTRHFPPSDTGIRPTASLQTEHYQSQAPAYGTTCHVCKTFLFHFSYPDLCETLYTLPSLLIIGCTLEVLAFSLSVRPSVARAINRSLADCIKIKDGTASFIFTVRRYLLHGISYRNSVCLSVCPSHSWTVSTWFDLRSGFLHHRVAPSF